MKTKICKKCGIEKNISDFRVMKHSKKEYVRLVCKKCEIIEKKEWRKRNPEKVKELKKKYENEHKEQIKQRRKKYYEENKEKYKQYYEQHKKEKKEYGKKYDRENREKINNRNKNRRKVDSVYKLRTQVRNLVRDSFKRKGINKSKNTQKIVGLSSTELYNYLCETFKNNYGYEWDGKENVHIDHIHPLKYAKTEEDVIKLNYYTNLQLLKEEDNLHKHAKLDWILTKQD